MIKIMSIPSCPNSLSVPSCEIIYGFGSHECEEFLLSQSLAVAQSLCSCYSLHSGSWEPKGKFTDSVNLSSTAYWWLAFSSDLVVGCGIPCLCDHILSEFWNFVKHFLKLFWTFFRCPWFTFTDSDAQFCFSLVFVSFLLFGGDRHIIHMFSLHVKHFFEKFVKKVSRKFLAIDLERKRAELFLVLPFLSMEFIKT